MRLLVHSYIIAYHYVSVNIYLQNVLYFTTMHLIKNMEDMNGVHLRLMTVL